MNKTDVLDTFGVPDTKIEFEKLTIRPRNRFKKVRKLSAKWTVELADDLGNMHGIDVDAEISDILVKEMQEEFDREFLKTMIPIPKSRFKKDPFGRTREKK